MQIEDEVERKSWFVNSPLKINFNDDETELWSEKLTEVKSSLKIFGEVGHDVHSN